MEIQLRYFTGTGNSLKVLRTIGDFFIENSHKIDLKEISQEEIAINNCDLIGFCFPVYAFAIPRIARKYLKSLKPFAQKQKAFVIITAGDAEESGFSTMEAANILKSKNCEIIYTAVVQMPINWTVAPIPPYPQPLEEALEIIADGVSTSRQIAADILKEKSEFHSFAIPPRYSKLKYYWDYYAFRYMGVQNMWRMFKVYESCTGCGICEKVCPTNSIQIISDKPKWSSTCEQCMRCVNFCPHESIFQTHGGDTKGKVKYHEPDFKPLKKK